MMPIIIIILIIIIIVIAMSVFVLNSPNELYDLIIVNLFVGEMISTRIIKFIKGRGYDGIIIGLTCCDDTYCQYSKIMLNAGADYVIVKPLNISKLEDTIGISLQEK